MADDVVVGCFEIAKTMAGSHGRYDGVVKEFFDDGNGWNLGRLRVWYVVTKIVRHYLPLWERARFNATVATWFDRMAVVSDSTGRRHLTLMKREWRQLVPLKYV